MVLDSIALIFFPRGLDNAVFWIFDKNNVDNKLMSYLLQRSSIRERKTFQLLALPCQ